MAFEITKKEMIYIVVATIFSLIWFHFIIPNFISSSPLTNFILFNLGIFIFLQILLKGFITNKFMPILEAIGFTILFIGIDLLAPPYVVSRSGELLNGLTLTNGSSDYIVAILGQSLGVFGNLLYYFSYVFMPLILFVIAALLLKDFIRKL